MTQEQRLALKNIEITKDADSRGMNETQGEGEQTRGKRKVESQLAWNEL